MAHVTRRRLVQAATAGLTATIAGTPLPASAQTATPRRGGTVTVALVQAPPSLDAQLTAAQVARDINLHMYETLYARDENAGAVPDLAQGAEVSKDGMTYVFALRQGVKFHNGKIMDCQGRGRLAGALPQDRAGIDPVERRRQDGGVRAARGDGQAEEGAVEFPRHAVLAGHAARDLSGRGGGQGPEGLQVHRHRPDEVRRIRARTATPRWSASTTTCRTRTTPSATVSPAGRRCSSTARSSASCPKSGARTAAIKTGEVLINETTDGPTAKQLASDPSVQVLKLLPFALQIAKFNHSQAPCDDVNFRRAVIACINAEETMAIAFPDIYKLDGGLVYGYSPYYTEGRHRALQPEQPGQGEGVPGEKQVQGRDAHLHRRQHPSADGHRDRPQGAARPDRHQDRHQGGRLADRLDARLQAGGLAFLDARPRHRAVRGAGKADEHLGRTASRRPRTTRTSTSCTPICWPSWIWTSARRSSRSSRNTCTTMQWSFRSATTACSRWCRRSSRTSRPIAFRACGGLAGGVTRRAAR